MPVIPLSLYIHIPWCIKKCPYCDFNSYASDAIPEQEYVKTLLDDMLHDQAYSLDREITSIFFGGGTPSLFSAKSIAAILDRANELFKLSNDIEITMETNPGSVEYKSFTDYKHAGVNRISFGVQSFDNENLERLGRIHKRDEVFKAYDKARNAAFEDINIDLMHGLPQQSMADAQLDLQTAISLEPEHISWYQLTIEPNTVFYNKPPELPKDDTLAEIQDAGEALLQQAGFKHYETSAYCQPNRASKHNLNYWQFGDYIGLGAGAHGKVTLAPSEILRYWKTRQPNDYLDPQKKRIAGSHYVPKNKLALEFMMNGLRLINGLPAQWFEQRTGQPLSCIDSELAQLKERQLLTTSNTNLCATPLGQRFLNDVLQVF